MNNCCAQRSASNIWADFFKSPVYSAEAVHLFVPTWSMESKPLNFVPLSFALCHLHQPQFLLQLTLSAVRDAVQVQMFFTVECSFPQSNLELNFLNIQIYIWIKNIHWQPLFTWCVYMVKSSIHSMLWHLERWVSRKHCTVSIRNTLQLSWPCQQFTPETQKHAFVVWTWRLMSESHSALART